MALVADRHRRLLQLRDGDTYTREQLSQRIQLAEAQRELRELRMENEFLKKAAAYFARDPR